ncbi:hypothetical protein AAA799E16_00918 [Marine Group I thaumarchaeote SCGC AAA799-E16]|uniref:Uncharacterized protein n=5 Tax=Marine Group I TaxID=905826 RepID=A0A087S6T6_9ARCH|nr:hypothetical protein AAA799N04_01752 [Marine Group I thaumarchaeote SCGC AAA799-N04]KER06401.1 hypothetical protein AAA799E16_00918 [Marine Group I thaumarchaeote SCGC AAA799-E16]KFM17184.1 hypothetical protein AAA799D11_00238 [Marine Group I thaumarchaeote SCGC AAA799-D11]KFM19042.1 hypothetical protein SCCGRSA3_00612 [Marine Group I thaumarchaeote SCGC RSA3]KFM21440.1 hypothetical protein AAA799B03_01012 [Marine Group I thaumarchaeote SCGC AAA799-B03]
MQKAGIILVASGALIVIGLILLAVGNQIILEGVYQGNGKISANQDLIISGEFNSEESPIGISAVQVMEFKGNRISAKILDPFDNEIVSKNVDEETIEEEFDIFETGEYKLIIQSDSSEETQVFGAIGPLPDAGKKSLSFVSAYILIIGMVGLVGSGIYRIKSRKKSV